MKKVTFKIFSSLFTLIAQILIERRDYSFVSLQVLSNLLTSAILNYTMSVGRPFFIYLISRYFFISYILKCKCCCCRPLRGKIEVFKEKMIRRMLVDEDTRDTFVRYCLDNKINQKLKNNLKKDKWVKLKKLINDNKVNKENRVEAKKRRIKKIFEKFNRVFEGFVEDKNEKTESEEKTQIKKPNISKVNKVYPQEQNSKSEKKKNDFEKSKNLNDLSFSSSHQNLLLNEDDEESVMKENSVDVAMRKDEWNIEERSNEKDEWELGGDQNRKRKISVQRKEESLNNNVRDKKKFGKKNKKVSFNLGLRDKILNSEKFSKLKGKVSKLKDDSSMRVKQNSNFLKVLKKKVLKEKGMDILPDKLNVKKGNELIMDFAEKIDLKKEKEFKGPKYNLGMNRKDNIRLRLREEFTKYILGREKVIETSYMLDLGKLEESFYSSLLIQFTFICFFTPYLLVAGLVSYIFNICVIILVINLYGNITRRPISRRVGNIEIWNQLYNMISYLGIIFNAIVIVTSGDQLGAKVLEQVVPGNRSSFRTVFDMQNALLVIKFLLSIMIPKLPHWIGKMQMRERLVRERARKKNSKILTRLSQERIQKEIEEKKKAFANAKKLKKNKIRKDRIQEKIKAQAMILEDDDTRSLKFFFKNNREMKEFEEMKFRVSNKSDDVVEMPRPRVKVRKVKKNNRRKGGNGY